MDLSKVTGTGIQGRVTRADVQAHVDAVPQQAAPSHDGDEERMPLSPVRRIIADNMVRSSSRIPQAWGVWETDVTGLVRLREAVRDEVRMRLGVNLTYLGVRAARRGGLPQGEPLYSTRRGATTRSA